LPIPGWPRTARIGVLRQGISLDLNFLKNQKNEGPKGSFKSAWSLPIGIFWKIHFINPPEVLRFWERNGLLLGGFDDFDLDLYLPRFDHINFLCRPACYFDNFRL